MLAGRVCRGHLGRPLNAVCLPLLVQTADQARLLLAAQQQLLRLLPCPAESRFLPSCCRPKLRRQEHSPCPAAYPELLQLTVHLVLHPAAALR